MPARIWIRMAVPADAGEVRSLFAAHLSALGLRPDPALDADMEDFPLGYDRPGAHFLVAEAPTGALVGMAGLLEGEIRRVFVDPHWRGQGIAKRLVMTLIGEQSRQEDQAARGGLGAPEPVGRGAASVETSRGSLLKPADETLSHLGQSFVARLADRFQETSPGSGVPRLWAVVGCANEASRRLFEACGFVPSGRTPAHLLMQHCVVL